MNLLQAQTLANGLIEELKPHCKAVVIAGSIRRKKSYPKDIEIVCIPKEQERTGVLFPDPKDTLVCEGFKKVVESWKKLKGEYYGSYTQRIVGSINGQAVKLDLFMCKPENFGYIFALRTGSSNFNQQIILPRMKSAGYTLKDGFVWDKNGEWVKVETEPKLFKLMGSEYIKPENRNY